MLHTCGILQRNSNSLPPLSQLSKEYLFEGLNEPYSDPNEEKRESYNDLKCIFAPYCDVQHLKSFQSIIMKHLLTFIIDFICNCTIATLTSKVKIYHVCFGFKGLSYNYLCVRSWIVYASVRGRISRSSSS